jgi:hypothetical protein
VAEPPEAVNITLDRQAVSQHCADCGVTFTVVRGSVYDAGNPMGLYLIALHGHSRAGRMAHLAVAVLGAKDCSPLAAAMDVTATAEQFVFTLVDWDTSPWRKETYLGIMLGADQVRAQPERATFFHVAGHVTRELPEIRTYFAEGEPK